jgi:hypothetical protein
MKLNSTPPMPNAPARKFTRNQAWAVDHALLDPSQRIFVRLVTDVGIALGFSLSEDTSTLF